MPFIGLTDLTAAERHELAAQQLACALLIRGCETALSSRRRPPELKETPETRVSQRSDEILRDVLASWRETLALLELHDLSGKPAARSGATEPFAAPSGLLIDEQEHASRAGFVSGGRG